MAIGRWLADGGLADVEQGPDVWVREMRNRFRFALDALAELRIGSEDLRQDLDWDDAIEPT